MERKTGSENVTIRFVVQTTEHEIFLAQHELYVVGNIAELGNWSLDNGIKMQQISLDRFEATITVPKNVQKTIEYKYVTLTNHGDEGVHWEHEGNRIIQKLDFACTQIQDHYRDAPLEQAPLEFVALDRILGRTHEPKICLDVPPSDNLVLVRFTLRTGTFEPQNRLGVTGGCNQLGNLVADNAVVMQYTYPNWEVDVYVPKNSFPLEYKYALLRPNFHELEDDADRCIELPPFEISSTDFAVHIHDDLVSCIGYFGITTSIGDMRSVISESQTKNCQISDLIYAEDDKLVVCSKSALAAANTYCKPIKKIRNVTRYELNLFGNSKFSELEALLDPECSFQEMVISSYRKLAKADIAKFSKVMKQNRTISAVKIISDDPDEMDSDVFNWNLTWLFDGLAKNEFPFISSLLIDTSTCEWDPKPMYQLLQTNTSLKTIKLICFKNNIDTCQLCHALEVNDSLTALEVSAGNIDCTLLARTIETKKNLKSLRITGAKLIDTKLVGLMRELHFEEVEELSTAKIEEIFKELKNSKVTTKFAVSAKGQYTDYLLPLIKSVFETNWILMDFSLWCAYRAETKEFIQQMCQRNRLYQKQLHSNIVMILHSIRRSSAALDFFPREVWLQIFSHVESPLGYDYHRILTELFKNSFLA